MKKPGKKRHKRKPRPKVFISYSHHDEVWKDRLLKQLSVLKKQGLLEVWEDSRIAAGDDWRPEIRQAMDAARAAILVITAEFLDSNFIQDEEVPRLLRLRKEKGLRVFPVIVKACPWRKVRWLCRMQIRPRGARPLFALQGNKRLEALTAIAEEIIELVRPPRRKKDTPAR